MSLKWDLSLFANSMVPHFRQCATVHNTCIITFLAFLIGNQGVIEKLEQNKSESRIIKTATLFEVVENEVLLINLI